ncbi:polyhydroxyalkanoate synthesis repressor PhaR [Oharaeibacter diazotrophicus]|uniref:Polyhydroxyalkanoate synthesis repressor PhaR n=1 Tax=Oharaeibacter diazotrophicus TaxID=1920512 RepID=A0A4R6RD67_9HYPH|nr:polyhydroxyalkanoate synthesis repressor PhaR [Oharaeibacter diazotrophicus]TDP84120.1 polyhydroxyalkanoate synthesis repressor PhaR [Oharaeibacter diazotrophicus]BBE73159.1 PHB/PHA accumulation regulator DNA-binding domain protein [Pleomorphomonas sp. SM30]GLS74948.1 polyhydroxyalkanoate synthesis repressor PhaR [Oharaeibacter diazotrophicus]
MAKTDEPTIIKKYANRRLYNTGTSTYVTLEDLAGMVKSSEDFVVYDAKSGEDITHSVLTQIIFEQENKGQNLLPITFLRQVIRFYGDSMQALLPSYLEHSMGQFSREQEKLRQQIGQAFGTPVAFDAMDETIRRNTEIFEKAFRMFMPFGAGGDGGEVARTEPGKTEKARSDDLDALKKQLEAMQRRLDQLAPEK